MNFALRLAAALALTPLVASQEPVVDRVKLRNGSTLEGTILSEAGGYIEMQLGTGITLGFERAKAAEVLRGVAPLRTPGARAEDGAGEPGPEPVRPVPRERDEWFLLHGLDGTSVGTVHLTVSLAAGDAGPLERIEESWVFTEEGRSHGITRVEHAGPDLQPVDFFFRELLAEQDTGRTIHEKIVRGERVGDQLIVEVMSPLGRMKRVERFGADMSFPLIFREGLRRQEARERKTVAVTLYEPLQETFVLRTFGLGGRREVHGLGHRPDEREEVSVLEEERWGNVHEEWIDRRGAIRRFEVNGAHLAARACTAEEAAAATARQQVVVAPQTRAEQGARFTASLPHPGWRFTGAETPLRDVIEMEDPARDATVRMHLLDQLGSEATTGTALAALENAFKLRHPDYRPADGDRREPATIEGTFAARAGTSGDKIVPFRALLHAIRSPAGFIGVTAVAPHPLYGVAMHDVRRAIAMIDWGTAEASAPAK